MKPQGQSLGTTLPQGYAIRLSEVHKTTGAELVSNSIVERNLGTKQKVMSQIRPHNTIVDEFGTSLPLNFGKVNCNAVSVRSRCFLRANCGRGKSIKAEEAGKPSAKQATMQYAIGEPASWFIKLLFIVYLRRVDDHGLFKKI